jgi:hypothetical protein
MKKWASILLISLVSFSCKKDINELPPATQSGANTFGAKVDGEMWIPQRFGVINASNLLEARLLGDNFYLTAQNFASSPNESEFDIAVIGLTSTGSYMLNNNTSHPNSNYSYAYYVKRKFTPLFEWITSTTYTGTVNITRFDTASRIVSGTFEFQAGETTNAAAPIRVTEGRFDVKY